MNKSLKGFITYSHEDTEAKDELRKRLAVMEQQNELVTWDDGQLTPGDGALQEDILKKVEDSDLLLYLVSAASLASKNCNKELAEALKQEIRVLPIILEHCDWLRHQLSGFEVLPNKGKPITKWDDESEGWQNVVDGIRKTVGKMRPQAYPSSGRSEQEVRAGEVFQYGNVQMLLGQLDMAIKTYSDAIKLNPYEAEMYNSRGVAFSLKGKYDSAISDYTEAINLNPNFVSAYGNRGAAYKEIGDVNSTIEDCTTAINLNSNFVSAYAKRGWAYSSKGEINRAIKDYSKVISLDPNFANAYNNRGVAYANKGDYDRAIRDFDREIKLNPRLAETYCNRGKIYRNKEDYDRAIADFNIAVNLDPNFANAYNNRGFAYRDRGEINRAILDFNKTIDLDPNNAEAYHNRGIIYGLKDKYDFAIKDFNTAIDIKRDYIVAYRSRGLAYHKKGEFDSAIENFNMAIDLNPDYAEAYYHRGAAYGHKGEIELAIEDCTKAIELIPDHAGAHYNRGGAYLIKDNIDQAITDFTTAIQLNPNDTKIYSVRGAAYCKKGDFDNAIEDLNIAIESNRSDGDAYHNRGSAYRQKGDVEEAIKDYTKAIELKPKFAVPYYNRGIAYSKKGELDKAIQNYTKAIQLNPNVAEAYYNRAEALLHLQEWEKAKADLDTAKDKGLDIVAAFRNDYRNVAAFEQKRQVKLPKDIVALVRQGFRHRYPMVEKALDADGKPLESPEVLELLQKFRDAGPPLGEYIKKSPYFGIETVPTEVFVVDGKIRDKLIAEHAASADILKPFLQGPDIRRWHVEPQDQWLISTHSGIEIKAYPAILKYLEKYKELLSKRGNQQEWYELQFSLDEAERFSQPKLVCPNLYNTQTFAVETEGLYCGYTCYVVPTDEKWLCGLLNTLPVEWFYSQASKQLDGSKLEARSEYIRQIPVPDINATQKDLVRKLVDYLKYLQQQPTTNSKDLAHARDSVMVGYFEWILKGLIYEFYMPDLLQNANRDIFKHLMAEELPEVDEIQGDKMSVFRSLYEHLHHREHPVRVNTFFQDGLRPIRIIEDKW